MEIETDNF